MTELTIPVPENLSNDPLNASIWLAGRISGAIEVLRPLVYEVYAQGLWEGRFSSFGEYVESPDGLNRSQGYASKLRQVEQFRLDSGLSEQDIRGIDYESMYLAIKTGGTPEEVVAKAKTLTRAELRASREDTNPCSHEWIEACKNCWRAKDPLSS